MRIVPVPLFLSLFVSAALHAQAPEAWSRVQQLAPGTSVKVNAQKGGGACTVQSITADSLICAHGKTTRSLTRGDIRSIKLARRGHSGAIGLALGAGIGAGVGIGVGEAINTSDSGSFVHVSGGKSAGVGAAVGAILGGATGGIVGYSADLFAGPVIYKR